MERLTEQAQGSTTKLEMEGIPTDFENLAPSEFGLDWGDISQIRERLDMTPTQRLERAQATMNAAIRIRSQVWPRQASSLSGGL